MQRIEKVYLEEIFVTDMVAEERDAFDERDVTDKDSFAVVGIAAIADCESMVDACAEVANVSVDYELSVVNSHEMCLHYSRSSVARLPLYTM